MMSKAACLMCSEFFFLKSKTSTSSRKTSSTPYLFTVMSQSEASSHNSESDLHVLSYVQQWLINSEFYLEGGRECPNPEIHCLFSTHSINSFYSIPFYSILSKIATGNNSDSFDMWNFAS